MTPLPVWAVRSGLAKWPEGSAAAFFGKVTLFLLCKIDMTKGVVNDFFRNFAAEKRTSCCLGGGRRAFPARK